MKMYNPFLIGSSISTAITITSSGGLGLSTHLDLDYRIRIIMKLEVDETVESHISESLASVELL